MAVLLARLPWWQQAVALLFWGVLAGLEWRHWRRPGVCGLQERSSDWWLAFADGREGGMRLAHAMVWRWLLVLDFVRPEAAAPGLPRRQRVVLLPDSLPADDFRRLRVRLALGPPPGKPLRG
mgnify:CR=1 FL=1